MGLQLMGVHGGGAWHERARRSELQAKGVGPSEAADRSRRGLGKHSEGAQDPVLRQEGACRDVHSEKDTRLQLTEGHGCS